MKTLILSLAGFVTCFAANPAGDWLGTLKTGGPELRLALHVRESGASFQATLDSIDQGANGIPVSEVSVKGNQLKLDIQAVKGGYEGQISEDGKTIAGTWSQGGKSMPLTFVRDTGKSAAAPDRSATAAPLAGVWEGTLDAHGKPLRVRFTLRKEGDQVQGKFDSLDQNANGIPISGLTLDGAKLHFDLRAVGGSYDGTVNAGRTAIAGTWKQGGAELPLAWKLVTELRP